MSKRAIILAGGKGTRLRPYTLTVPKPLMPIGDKTILEIIILQLVSFGFDHITLAVNHQAELIKAFCSDGSRWGVKINYSLENTPLGTMGPLTKINDLPENFLVMNGDILTDLDYGALFEKHLNTNSTFTISSYFREQEIDYGVLETSGTTLLKLIEKPTYHFEVSMGIYVASSRILDVIPENTNYGFDDLMEDLIKSGTSVNVQRFSGYWLDIGRPDDFKKAAEEFQNESNRFIPE